MTTEFPWPHGNVTKHWDTGLMECDICHRQGRTMRELAEQPCVEPAMTHDPLCLLGERIRDLPAEDCARCEFIAKVRADEGQQFVSVLLDNAIVDLDALMAALQARQQSRKGTDI